MTSHPPNRGPKNPGSNPPPTEIRAAREAAGLTQTEAGALIYSSARTWQNWEAPPELKMTTITKLIEANEIRIVSGEGAVGASEIYSGKRTIRAIKMRLTKERCGGDRWANANVFSHSNEFGNVFVDIETGEYC